MYEEVSEGGVFYTEEKVPGQVFVVPSTQGGIVGIEIQMTAGGRIVAVPKYEDIQKITKARGMKAPLACCLMSYGEALDPDGNIHTVDVVHRMDAEMAIAIGKALIEQGETVMGLAEAETSSMLDNLFKKDK